MSSADRVKAAFDAAILAASESAYGERAWDDSVPRRRKLPPEVVMKMLCCFGGNSLQKEIKDYPGVDVSASSFVEARGKISSMTFYDALMRFNSDGDNLLLYKGRNLVGVDGVHVRTSLNPDSISYQPGTSNTPGFNEYLCVVFLDLLSRVPVDVCFASRRQDELGGAMGMLAYNPLPASSIIVGDRLYSAYGFIADAQCAPVDFLIRTKQGSGAMKFIRDLPMEEFDIQKQIVLTDSQSKASRERGEIYVNTGSKRGKVNSPKTYVSRFAHSLPYIMNLRIARVKLQDGSYETLLTSLPESEFSPSDLRNIYKLRWNIELYFRHIKHDCGLVNMHSKIEDYSRQQIFATFLFSSAVWRIVNSVALQQKESNTYTYGVNIKMATYLVRNFLRDPEADSDQLLRELTRYVVPIRADRSEERRLAAKSFVPFTYRVA